MIRIVSITVNRPSNFGGAEVVWYNLQKEGLRFENLSLLDLPFFYSIVPNLFHLREVIGAKYLVKKAIKTNPNIIFYDKIFGWSTANTLIKKICYNHGSYTLAGLKFKEKNLFVYFFYKYILNYFERKSYINADKIIAVSESVKNEMIDYFKIPEEKIRVINNGIDLNKFRSIKNKVNLRKKHGFPVNKRILLFPGRPSFGKGFNIAKKLAKNMGDKIELVVLSGKKRKRDKNILYLEKISNQDMPELYNAADLIVFPSRYEGNSVSVLESAACGTPLVLSNTGLMRTESSMQEFVCNSIKEYEDKINDLFKRDNFYKASKKWLNFSKKFPLKKQIRELNEFIKNGTKR